ncbi:MAG: quinone-interacting membrane-bound oxidoreductase complex subunit QmoC [Candidatus Zixiibacteriota bacterium]|nr:MAG: quinone-interacting membrane-bound oxidoreductase complex subunit QmoC [candidate division Zixibacteria bacterium]
MAAGRLVEPDLDFIREVKRAGGSTVKKCFQCATCSVVCNQSSDENPFPRKEMILTGWGQAEKLVSDSNVWLCYQCNDCTTYCPRGARPGDVLAAVRSYIYKNMAFPSFMGKALANPRVLPLLILVPVVILAACILAFAPRGENGGLLFMQSSLIDYNYFLPHSSVDALFVFGNIMIFIFAAVGFVRFWKFLKGSGGESKITFSKAFILTVKEIFSHGKFSNCGVNRARAVAHFILFYGFIGAMITTGAIFIFIFVPHYLSLLGLESLHPFFELPINLPHPVKIIGGLSGLALVVGTFLLIYRRSRNRDEVGANGYADYLFLYILFFTGLSGMLSWLIRYSGAPIVAYLIYFVHMVCVFFLLWYMPYSKFAHMIYRTLAIVYAKKTGRD